MVDGVVAATACTSEATTIGRPDEARAVVPHGRGASGTIPSRGPAGPIRSGSDLLRSRGGGSGIAATGAERGPSAVLAPGPRGPSGGR
jgi:hypothetical protein